MEAKTGTDWISQNRKNEFAVSLVFSERLSIEISLRSAMNWAVVIAYEGSQRLPLNGTGAR